MWPISLQFFSASQKHCCSRIPIVSFAAYPIKILSNTTCEICEREPIQMTIITWPVKNVTISLKASKINVASTLLLLPPPSPPRSEKKTLDTPNTSGFRFWKEKRDRPLIDGIVVIRAAQTSWSSFLLSEHNTFTTFCPFSPLITLPKFLLPESNLLSLLSLGLNHRTGLHRVITGILTTCWVNS